VAIRQLSIEFAGDPQARAPYVGRLGIRARSPDSVRCSPLAEFSHELLQRGDTFLRYGRESIAEVAPLGLLNKAR